MPQRENRELNAPAGRFFERKLKCAFSTTEFTFSAGKLDVLAYNRSEKCFHVAEGKLARRIASVGHAVGQLVAYISMLQESGFDFLDRISKEANLYLTDFVEFLESKSIKVCFYIVLPGDQRARMLDPTLLVLKNVGDFGEAIGILFAAGQKCTLVKQARPITVKIRKRYTRDEFLAAIRDRFLATRDRDFEGASTRSRHLVQFREKEGNSQLHFEVAFHRKKKGESTFSFDTAFHLELAAAWQKDAATLRRANKIRRAMKAAHRILREKDLKFKYQQRWGKAWSRLYMTSRTQGQVLDDEELKKVLEALEALVDTLVPFLRKIDWGRRRKKLDS